MFRGKERLDLMRPVRLYLDKPLEGPYKRLMRRAAPEVEALETGQTSVILRGSGIRQPVPLVAAWVNSFYCPGGNPVGLRPEDFNDISRATAIYSKIKIQIELKTQLLVVPVGHIRLPNAAWISRLAAALTPWTEPRVETWRCYLQHNPWLSVLRVYHFEPVAVSKKLMENFQTAVPAFRIIDLQPVLSDDAFDAAIQKIHTCLDDFKERSMENYTKVKVAADLASEKEPIGLTQSGYSVQELAADCGYSQELLEQWEYRIRRKQQAIFYGPPGTGKTYMAERLAKRLIAGGQGYSQVLQFHAAYAYEDFVQGLRPKTVDGQVVFELKEGRFLEFCRRAAQVGADQPCVLVLDEINRAPLARIFGELMYLLEYRERSIPLAAGGEPFKIPQNIYLIGTMNTADRSLVVLDQALRRRFTFIRLQPEYVILSKFLRQRGVDARALIHLLKEINQCIADQDFLLGIAFFMQDSEPLGKDIAQIWQGEIEPYLEEIFFDQPQQIDAWRWESSVRQRLGDGLSANATD